MGVRGRADEALRKSRNDLTAGLEDRKGPLPPKVVEVAPCSGGVGLAMPVSTYNALHARIGMTINLPGNPMSVTQHYFNHE